jgi:pilus assembly protein CpaF
MRDQISSALHLVLQVARLSDGTRRVTSVVEVTGMEGDVITTQEIYRFARRGISPDGHVIGTFEPTGIRPKFLERLQVAGAALPADMLGAGAW